MILNQQALRPQLIPSGVSVVGHGPIRSADPMRLTGRLHTGTIKWVPQHPPSWSSHAAMRTAILLLVGGSFHLIPSHGSVHLIPSHSSFHLIPSDGSFHLIPNDASFHLMPSDTGFRVIPRDASFDIIPGDEVSSPIFRWSSHLAVNSGQQHGH